MDQELPHFIRRLLSAILHPKQAKNTPVDSTTRLHKSIKALTEAFHNVLLFQTLWDKLAVMEVFKNQSPYKFEDMQVTFLLDLCRATLV
ncbi:Hypothetical predicted protein [Pelobates cultripes]|uniref:Uncharacterized protein n=1 Tax=Pelobates cultripes TaxID=61616 RepID=A0AAD1RWN0_PELCU|nr:Hypothetical predicted protein [Pelobates cultripes]